MAHRGWLVVLALLCACHGSSARLSNGFVLDTLPGGIPRSQNGAEGRWARMGQKPWALREDLRIGGVEGNGPDVFGQVRNVIPGVDSTIWVLDEMAHQLRQFGSDGSFMRVVGRGGQGPGEFGPNPCAFAGPDHEIWVENSGRLQRFSADGKLLGEQLVTRFMGCQMVGWRGDELAAVTARFGPGLRPSEILRLYDRLPDGSVAARDTVPLLEPEAPLLKWSVNGKVLITERVPFAPSPTLFLQHDGVIWRSDGGESYRFRRQSLEGDTLLMVSRHYVPIPVPDSIRRAAIDSLKLARFGYPDDFDPSVVPHVFPPFDRIIEALDGTIWVRRRVEREKNTYDVFAANGEFLGPVAPPPGVHGFRVGAITSNHIYGVARDTLDVQYVVRLRIQK